ncbi:Endonuclease/exonuclease/phosphatase [Truncatella angustata]|uniref:Endonuclease/exonuclease/phosphatase n=1 Tax=Truncatella angustata TaxID=152316 RepID=A0A9P8UN24_9PEZI|nr:Endonuclease/exonuclease/phosphatase [Truncatella angustata]KAH6655217.1 Endonuclease/exonuclease/phosphatase [Truncatella angustata]
MPETDDLENDLTQTSTQYSLSRALHARKDEFVRPHRIRIKVGSWNVAACPGTDKDLASWFVDGEGVEPRFDTHLADQSLKATSQAESHTDEPKIRVVGGSDIGLYVLGLQEIIPLNGIAGYTDTTATEKWKAALEAAMPPYYKLIAAQQLSGLLLLIYASPDVADTVSNVSTVSVGTGLFGYMGNKGGVSTRIVLGETTRVVFTDCHLASGHDQTNLERRWWDYNKILSQTQFSPISHSGVSEDEAEKIGDEDFAFWFGDLNFRLDGLPGDDIRRLLMLHTRGEYDLANKTQKSLSDNDGVIIMQNKDPKDGDGTDTPGMLSREASFNQDDSDDENAELPDPNDFVPDPHDDPASLQATLDSLLPHDQLATTIKDRKAFHEGWSEGPITFLPSYKYDIGTVGLFDSSEKRRAPSWCDRILYRTKTDLDKYKTKIKEEEESKKKDEDMKKRGIDAAADDESVLFDYDPDKDTSSHSVNDSAYDYDEYDEDEVAEGEGQTVVTKEGYEDHIRLDLYTTHQGITSSDHKPIVALFTLDYDAVVPELKAKVHAEVARELDRAENEGRPGITIVVDTKEGGHHEDQEDDGSGGVDFGDVEFMKPITRTLTVANTGGVHAKIGFVAKPGIDEDEARQAKNSSNPEWLSVSLRHFSDSTSQGPEIEPKTETNEITLEPGETASAALTISVTSLSHLQSLNSGTTSLEDVLVLRVTDGRDHFIPVRANAAPSCFGRSIEELIRVTPREGGLRGFVYKLRKDKDDVKEWKGGSIPYNLNPHSSSPPELYKLTAALEALAERVTADESMVQEDEAKVPRDKAGWPFIDDSTNVESGHISALIRALDVDDPTNLLDALPKTELSNITKLEIVAKVMLLFLRSLVDGVIPAPLFAKIESALPAIGSSATSTRPAKEIEDDKSTILDILAAAPYHNISFVFVTSMLAKLAAEITPLNPKELELLNSDAKSKGTARKLSFRRSILGAIGAGVDQAAIQKRLAWENMVAEIFGPAVCRTANAGGDKGKDKERKASEERMKGLLELFMRRRDGV